MRKLPCMLLLFMLVLGKVSVGQSDYALWTRVTLGYKFGEKLQLDSEVQYRRQNLESNHLQFNKPLLNSVRIWLHQDVSKNWQISLSPFAYFDHSQINLDAVDGVEHSKEIRISVAAIGRRKLTNYLQLFNRSALESRHLLENKHFVLRARNRLGLKYRFQDNLSLQLSEELLVNPIGKNWIDHNRLMASVDIHLNPKLKTELGYLFIHRYKAKEDSFHKEQIAMINLHYSLR